jgi:heme/copper-type cytochrome/quinol oxidase subunit 3
MENVNLNLVFTRKTISNGVLGMIFLLSTEAMFFAGLISAYIVNRSMVSVWPPYDQPRLPIEVTAINTIILILSACCFFLFSKKFKNTLNKSLSKRWLFIAILLGSNFLFIQGTEWFKLIEFGLTSKSNLYGAFFYLIIGAHGLHVLAGILILIYLLNHFIKSKNDEEVLNKINMCGMYWYFVVGIWPILYVLVYLS